MLRIWLCDCAFCAIGNEFPCRQTTQSHNHPLTRAIHIAPRTKTTRRFHGEKPLITTDLSNFQRLVFRRRRAVFVSVPPTNCVVVFLAVLVISLFFSKFVKTIIHITYNSHAL